MTQQLLKHEARKELYVVGPPSDRGKRRIAEHENQLAEIEARVAVLKLCIEGHEFVETVDESRVVWSPIAGTRPFTEYRIVAGPLVSWRDYLNFEDRLRKIEHDPTAAVTTIDLSRTRLRKQWADRIEQQFPLIEVVAPK